MGFIKYRKGHRDFHLVVVVMLAFTVSCAISEGRGGKGNPQPARNGNSPQAPATVEARAVPNIGRPGVLLYNLRSTNQATVEFTVRCTSRDLVYRLAVITSNSHVAVPVGGAAHNVSCRDAVGAQHGPGPLVVSQGGAGSPVEDDRLDVNTATASRPSAGGEETSGSYRLGGEQGDANSNSPYGLAVRDREPLYVGVEHSGKSPYVGVVRGGFNVTLRARNIGRSFFIIIAEKVGGSEDSRESNVAGIREGEGEQPGKQVTRSLSPPGSGGVSPLRMGRGGSGSGGAAADAGADTNDNSDAAAVVATGGGGNAGGGGGGDVQKPARASSPGRRLHKDQVGLAMVIVMQLPRAVDQVFRVVLRIVIIMATAGMGLKVNVKVVMQVLKKPVGPAIGLVCQFLAMPLIAYGVAKSVPQENAATALGIFTCGVVPGGGLSNMFCFLLDGDVSLSVTMTTLSNIAALGLTPLWIFTLGSTFSDDEVELEVPYLRILETLAYAIVPLFVGIFVQLKLPKVKKFIVKVLKPVILVFVAGVIALAIYTNLYVFQMLRPMVILAGCLLPYIGYLVGGIVSLLCCQSWRRVKTIAIETGIQNTGIAFMMLYLSLPPPDNQLSSVGPAASAIMTPQPLFLTVIVYMIYKRCTRPPVVEKASGDGDDDDDDDDHDDNDNNRNGGKSAEKGKKNKEAEAEEGLVSRNRKGGEPEEVPTGCKCLPFLNGGSGEAAIIVIWEKLTGSKKPDPATEMLNHELTVPSPVSTSDDIARLWDQPVWDMTTDGNVNKKTAGGLY